MENSGTRVRIRHDPIDATLRSRLGWIVSPDPDWEHFSVVRLDSPAIYHRADGIDEDLSEIVIADENIERLDTGGAG